MFPRIGTTHTSKTVAFIGLLSSPDLPILEKNALAISEWWTAVGYLSCPICHHRLKLDATEKENQAQKGSFLISVVCDSGQDACVPIAAISNKKLLENGFKESTVAISKMMILDALFGTLSKMWFSINEDSELSQRRAQAPILLAIKRFGSIGLSPEAINEILWQLLLRGKQSCFRATATYRWKVVFDAIRQVLHSRGECIISRKPPHLTAANFTAVPKNLVLNSDADTEKDKTISSILSVLGKRKTPSNLMEIFLLQQGEDDDEELCQTNSSLGQILKEEAAMNVPIWPSQQEEMVCRLIGVLQNRKKELMHMKQETLQPTRKKRGGRKLGSKNKPKPILVEAVEAPKKKRGRPFGSKSKSKLTPVDTLQQPKKCLRSIGAQAEGKSASEILEKSLNSLDRVPKKMGRPPGSKNKPKLLPSDIPARTLESNPTLLFGGAVQEKSANDTLLSAQIYRDLKISLPEQGERRPITARDTFLGGYNSKECSTEMADMGKDQITGRRARGKDRQPRVRTCFKRSLPVPQSANNMTEGAQKNAQ